MATTLISDVIVPEIFNSYVVEKTAELANFYLGGIVSSSPALDALASAGGKLLNMPFWSDLTGDDEVLSDSGALTPAKISSGLDIAALQMRGRAWSVNDLAKSLSGDDPMAAVGDLVADYWARKYQSVGLSSLAGVMLDNIANNAGDMSITAGAAMSGDVFIDGQSTFGDAMGKVAGIAMHSVVYHNLKKLDNISFEKESNGNLEIETYRGLRLVVDDSLPSGATYTSYMFGQGALGMGQGAAPVPTETDRDSLAGDDILITRSHFLMHPRGVAFQSGSVVGAAPTNTELGLAANWSRVYERKNVRIAQIITTG